MGGYRAMTVSTRRMGTAQSETRTLLLDIAEQLMRNEGYAAVTSRQLAKAANLSPQIVYYYFRTMDDLFEALFLRVAQFYSAAIEEAANAPEPLLALWKLSCDPTRAVVISELMALSNHRKGLQRLIADFGRAFHERQTEIVARTFEAGGIDTGRWPPGVIAALVENAARSFALGGNYGIPGHEEAREFVTDRLREFVGARAEPRRRRGS
jgi:TetR/AcrR family transcriptional regulator